jgi:hypothetical protein
VREQRRTAGLRWREGEDRLARLGRECGHVRDVMD